jgi:flagellar motor switch protein FliM
MSNKKNTTEARILLADKFNEMPMLKSIFKSFISNLQISIAKYINCNMEIKSEAILHINTSEYINTIKGNNDCIAVEYNFAGLNTESFFIFIQKEIIYRIIEIILGGKNLESSLTVDNRLFSQIEKNIISNIIDILTMELQDVFLLTDSDIKIIRQNICYFQYEYDNLNDDVVFFGRSTIKIKESTGKMDVIIPYNTLLPIKSTLIKTFSNKKLIQQDIWKNHMKKTISDTDVELTVEVDAIQTINDVEKMKVGDTIITSKNAEEAFAVKINGVKVYDCKIGKVNEKIAVELINDIL